MTSIDISREIVDAVSRELSRQLPAAIAKYQKNPHQRGGGEAVSIRNGSMRPVLPEIMFDGRQELWVGCHQDEKGEPLICITTGGRLIPIATVDGMEGIIARYREA